MEDDCSAFVVQKKESEAGLAVPKFIWTDGSFAFMGLASRVRLSSMDFSTITAFAHCSQA